MVNPGRPRGFDTDRALEAAMNVFWRLGYEGASIAELTRAMGINPPSLYAAFGSKDGLFRAVLDHYQARKMAYVGEIMSAPTARQAATALLDGVIGFATAPEAPRGCLLLQGGLACGLPDVPQELARRRAVIERLMQDRFARARAEGEWLPTEDLAGLASYLNVVCMGIAIQASAGAHQAELHGVARMALSGWPVPEAAAPRACAARSGNDPARPAAVAR